MGYNVRVDGELDIQPHLTWADLQNNPFYVKEPGYQALRIEYSEETVNVPEGKLIKRTGIAFSYGGALSEMRAYRIEEDLKRALKSLPKGTTLTGWMDCLGEDGEVWRYAVKDGEVVEVKPQIVWPEWMK